MERYIVGDNLGFIVNVEEKSDTSVKFIVEEITSRGADNYDVADTEPYLECYIKWDGCSHFWFGDEDGYIHICGVDSYVKHIELIRTLYSLAFVLMEKCELEKYPISKELDWEIPIKVIN